MLHRKRAVPLKWVYSFKGVHCILLAYYFILHLYDSLRDLYSGASLLRTQFGPHKTGVRGSIVQDSIELCM